MLITLLRARLAEQACGVLHAASCTSDPSIGAGFGADVHLCTHLFTGAPLTTADAGLTVCLWCPGELCGVTEGNVLVQKAVWKRALPVFLWCVFALEVKSAAVFVFQTVSLPNRNSERWATKGAQP